VTRNESSTNIKSFGTPPVTPVHTYPICGFAQYQASRLQVNEASKDQSMFQEVDLAEVKSRDRHRSADKENVPPPGINHGPKRLTISPATTESNASIARIPKAYRPPTPPRPSCKRTSAPPTPVTTTMTKPMHIVFPDPAGLGTETNSQRTGPDDDITDTRTARSSLTMWTDTRGVSMDASTSDDDDRTLPVYESRSVRKSTTGSKLMVAVEPQRSKSGFWKTLKLWFDSILNSFKSCLSGY